jgi:urocanate hydratase
LPLSSFHHHHHHHRQFPHELITYGGNGSAFSNWAQYHLTMKYLSEMTETQTLCLHSGHPMGLFPSNADAPRLIITNGMVVPNYSTREMYEHMYAIGVSQYGQMTAGSFCYIGPQGIVHGTTLTLLNAGRKFLGLGSSDGEGGGKGGGGDGGDGGGEGGTSLNGKLFVTAGLGGMSGAQPKAAVICGAVAIVAEVDGAAVEKRFNQGWVLEKTDDLDECLKLAKNAMKEKRGTSIAFHGNVVDLWERLAADAVQEEGEKTENEKLVPHLGSDQTSCHNPFGGGYYPVDVGACVRTCVRCCWREERESGFMFIFHL